MRIKAEVWVATESEQVREAVKRWGGRVLMSSPTLCSGTERIASVLDQLSGDLILNVQGDEPFVFPQCLDALVACLQQTETDLVTAVFRIEKEEDLWDPNVVKVVRASDGQALYFSRSTIPYLRDVPRGEWLARGLFWGHLGVYGQRREILEEYPSLPIGRLEEQEMLEQLRFLERGYRFHTVETDRTIAIDTEEDLKRAQTYLFEG